MLQMKLVVWWMRNFYLPRFKLQEYTNISAIVSQEDIRDEFVKRNSEYTISAIHVTNSAVEDLANNPSDDEILDNLYTNGWGGYEDATWTITNLLTGEDNIDNGYTVQKLIFRN